MVGEEVVHFHHIFTICIISLKKSTDLFTFIICMILGLELPTYNKHKNL